MTHQVRHSQNKNTPPARHEDRQYIYIVRTNTTGMNALSFQTLRPQKTELKGDASYVSASFILFDIANLRDLVAIVNGIIIEFCVPRQFGSGDMASCSALAGETPTDVTDVNDNNTVPQ